MNKYLYSSKIPSSSKLAPDRNVVYHLYNLGVKMQYIGYSFEFTLTLREDDDFKLLFVQNQISDFSSLTHLLPKHSLGRPREGIYSSFITGISFISSTGFRSICSFG